MDALPLIGNALHKAEMEYSGKFGHTLGQIHYISLMSRIEIFTQPAVYQPKMWHLLFLVFKVSSAVFNIWLVTLINAYFILIVFIMAQISSDSHGVGIKWKTTHPRIFWIVIKIRIML